jgi:hypothetical protein
VRAVISVHFELPRSICCGIAQQYFLWRYLPIAVHDTIHPPPQIEFTESRASQNAKGGAGVKQGANQKAAGDYGPRSERPEEYA